MIHFEAHIHFIYQFSRFLFALTDLECIICKLSGFKTV